MTEWMELKADKNKQTKIQNNDRVCGIKGRNKTNTKKRKLSNMKKK